MGLAYLSFKHFSLWWCIHGSLEIIRPITVFLYLFIIYSHLLIAYLYIHLDNSKKLTLPRLYII